MAQIVQEDFMLLQKNSDGQWCFVAGVGCLSFTDMGLRGQRGFMKPGAPLDQIHAPVPNFKEHMYSAVNHIFNTIKVKTRK